MAKLSDADLKERLLPKDLPESIAKARLLCVRQALACESRGMRLTRRGVAPTGLTICKKEFGLKAKTAGEMQPLFEALLQKFQISLVR